MRAFRGEISDVSADIVIGPYPVARDFEKLKSNGVKTIVSLLDPSIPYESKLIDQETILANNAGMVFLNFPMISILGQKMGDHYDQNAAAAAKAIAESKGKVYVHCYLGIHRVMVVKKILDGKKITTGRYTFQQGERSEKSVELDKAEELYHQGYFNEANQVIESMSERPTSAKLLYAWIAYRQGNISESRTRFMAVSGLPEENLDRDVGLAYCRLRENPPEDAAMAFSKVLASYPENESALTGLGIALYYQGQLKAAKEKLEKAVKINPANTDAVELLKKIGTTN